MKRMPSRGFFKALILALLVGLAFGIGDIGEPLENTMQIAPQQAAQPSGERRDRAGRHRRPQRQRDRQRALERQRSWPASSGGSMRPGRGGSISTPSSAPAARPSRRRSWRARWRARGRRSCCPPASRSTRFRGRAPNICRRRGSPATAGWSTPICSSGGTTRSGSIPMRPRSATARWPRSAASWAAAARPPPTSSRSITGSTSARSRW